MKSLSTLLFIVFLILKLTRTIDWSWLWVTCPLWSGLAVILGGLLFLGVVKYAEEKMKGKKS